MSRLLLGALVTMVAQSASAHDPAIEWQTVATPAVRVHFPKDRYAQALAVLAAAERALAQLENRLASTPDSPIEIVLDDETDSANGSANVLPYNLVELNLVSPPEVSELAAYDDWVTGLVTHELAHIVHIGTVSGLPHYLNYVFGRWFFPNGAQPRWFIEGIATYFESALTSAGRVNSSYFDMQLRADLLSDTPFSLSQVTGAPLRWPQGTVAYLYGSYFLNDLSHRFGERTLAFVTHDYGNRLLPWALNLSIERATGALYPELYGDFLGHLKERFSAQANAVDAAGRREGEQLTFRGQEIGPARVAKDGTIYFVEAPIDGRSMLRALAPSGETRDVAHVYSDASLALTPDGRTAVIAQIEVSDVYYTYGDLFTVDLASGDTERRTYGARIATPDISADGEQLVFVQQDGVHSVLCLGPFRNPALATVLADLGPMTQVYSPRFSPDGKRVVFSGFRDGMRDLFLVDLDTRMLRQLTHDVAQDGSPVFTPDGTGVFFHSDHGGIFDLFMLPLDAGAEPRRLTRVYNGAFRPELTPEGDALIYVTYGPSGFDLARLALGDASTWPPDDTPALRGPPIVVAAPPVVRARAYNPMPTLAPRAWIPLVYYDEFGATLGLSFSGQDAVGRHAYALTTAVDTYDGFISFDAVYDNATFFPGVTLRATRSAGYATFPYLHDGHREAVRETLWTADLSTGWPIYKSRESALSLVTSYGIDYRVPREPLRFTPLDIAPRFPDEGRFAHLGLGLVFSNTQSYIDSISKERGVSLRLRLDVEDPYLGSQYSSSTLRFDGDGYLANPWVNRHVLAASVFLGYGASNYIHRRLFSIGGLTARDVLLDTLNLRVGAPLALRGFDVTFSGDALAAGSLEYRFPIYDVETGISTLPIYFRTLHAAAFFDAAMVGAAPRELWEGRHAAVGGELDLNILAGYFLPVTVRVGYGYGLGSDNVQAFYLVLGNTF